MLKIRCENLYDSLGKGERHAFMLWRCDWRSKVFVKRLLKQSHKIALVDGESW